MFATASITDAIDGYLARSRNWVTTFGKLMDPIADELLIVAALVALVSLGRLVLIAVDGRPLWVSLLVYATVVVTVLSGADYFFGLRPASGPARHGARRRGAAPERLVG